MKKPIVEQSWETEFGTINVGEACVVVTEGYSHRIQIRKGKYLGYVEQGIDYRTKEPRRAVKAEVEVESYVYFKKGTNIRCSWSDPDREMRKAVIKRQTTLQLNRILPMIQGGDQMVSMLAKTM